jgi:acyl-CoA thioester hydrolase/thioesterase-3
MPYKRFETEITVRPDDIDVNNHVHSSRYLDYVLAARYDQMERCYGMPMTAFLSHGWSWYVKSIQIDFRRAIMMGEKILVKTWLDSFAASEVLVRFQIVKKDNRKIAAEGTVLNTMINIATGRTEPIPDWVIGQYAQFME